MSSTRGSPSINEGFPSVAAPTLLDFHACCSKHNRKKTMKKPYAMLMLAAALVAFGGCNGCGTLDPQGVYQGDKFLYDADLTITTGYEVMHRFVKWEYDNREALKASPKIKQAADKVRAGAPKWIADAIRLRDAYKANPTPDAKTAYQKALDVIREAVLEATGYLASREVQPETAVTK